jgi:subtilisin family serine protease
MLIVVVLLVLLQSLVYTHEERVDSGGEWVRLTNHMPGASLFGAKSQPIHKTLVFTLARTRRHEDWDDAQLSNFTQGLAQALLRDGSALSLSSITPQYVTLKIYCPLTMDDNVKTDDVPPLTHMGQFLDGDGFARVEVGVNKLIQRPAQWYGVANPDQVKLLLNNPQRTRIGVRRVRAKAVQFPAPWGPDRIDEHFGPLDNKYYYNFTGIGVNAYVLDTGILTSNVEFQGRANFLANTVGDGINTDCEGHGTHVSSLLGGMTYGVAKQVTLQGIKVLGCDGDGDLFTISSGITAAIAHKQAQSINGGFVASMSLGGEYSLALNQAVLALVQNGIATVVAAGNEAGDACQYSPSSLAFNTAVVSVGASTSQDGKASFSNYGQCLSLFAPGVGIVGAYIPGTTSTATLSGSSMSTPFVGGVAALTLQQNPLLTPANVKSLVLSWSTPLAISGTFMGNHSLLYSLIDVNSQPDFVPPQIPPSYFDSAEASYNTIVTPLTLLCLSLSYILL